MTYSYMFFFSTHDEQLDSILRVGKNKIYELMKFGRATRMIELCVHNIVNPIVVVNTSSHSPWNHKFPSYQRCMPSQRRTCV